MNNYRKMHVVQKLFRVLAYDIFLMVMSKIISQNVIKNRLVSNKRAPFIRRNTVSACTNVPSLHIPVLKYCHLMYCIVACLPIKSFYSKPCFHYFQWMRWSKIFCVTENCLTKGLR